MCWLQGSSTGVQFNVHPEITGRNGEGGGEGSGSGEAGENHGNEGSESSSGEAGSESGINWAIDATAIEIVNGVRLALIYDATDETFYGTIENLNTIFASQARVEVHVIDANGNSVEYGPTTPADLQAGEMREIILPAPGSSATSIQFNMHPEIG